MSARKIKPAPKIQKNQNLQVFVRCRPPSTSEINQRSSSVVDINGQKEIVVQDRCNSKISRTFSFDKVFGPAATQSEVYKNVVEPLISDVLAGFNCTVFAYGQTGSGKTFTMEGDFGSQKHLSPESNSGLIPRAMCALFDELRVLQAEYTVRMSLMELYNEELYDLLSADEVPPKLRLFDDSSKKGSVFVQGLQEVMVHTQSQVLEELRKGSAKRQVAATLMNAHSSRSHTIFTVTVHCKENSSDGEEFLRTGKLNLVDLAGSENIGRSGSSDKRAREAASINQSLLTLSRVTSCLVEHQPHVPYRESKLTRLLQDSLGGRTKTSLIATISPSHLNVEETISTLDYALRAKSVSNKPEVNQKVSQNVIMKEYTDVIESLKKKLDRHRNGSGVYVNDENYKQVMDQTQERNNIIFNLIAEARSLKHKLDEADETFKALSKKKEDSKRNLENVNQTILKTTEEIECANSALLDARVEQAEAVNILKEVSNKENELRMQAEQYVKVIDSASSDTEKIHNRLDFSRVVISENTVVLKNLREKTSFFNASTVKLVDVFNESRDFLDKLSACVDKLSDDGNSSIAVFKQVIMEHHQKTACTAENVKKLGLLRMAQVKAQTDRSLSKLQSFYEVQIRIMEETELLLKAAISDFNKLMLQLPQQSASLLDFVQKSVENFKLEIRKQANQMKSKLNTALSGTEINIQVVEKLLGNLLLQEEMIRLQKIQQVINAKRLAIAELCSDSKKVIYDHQLEHQRNRKKRENSVLEVDNKLNVAIDYIQQQPTEVFAPIRELKSTFDLTKGSLESELSSKFDNEKRILEELGAIAMKSKDEVSSLQDSDMQDSITHTISECKQILAEGSGQIKTQVGSLNNAVEDTANLQQMFVAKHDEILQIKKDFEEEEDEFLGMFLDGVSSATTEVQEQYDLGKEEICEILSSNINQDLQTGQTPNRRSYGSIPEPSFLSSPIKRTARSKIERAPWKKLLRSPRKPLTPNNIICDDDKNDGMASDSEVSFSRKASGPSKLQKASSLCDLRSNTKSGAVFHRPRIPKKIARNGPVKD